MAVDVKLLASFPNLQNLGEADRKMMSGQLSSERYRAGAQICREGDAGDACWFLAEGKVVVTKSLPDGRRVKLAELNAGTMFGQAGLIEGQLRTADVRAEGEVVVLKLPRAGLLWSQGRGHAWAIQIQNNLAVDLVRQLRTALGKVSELATLEDPSLAAEGKTRDTIPQAQAVEVGSPSLRSVRPVQGGMPVGATLDLGPSPEPVESPATPRSSSRKSAMDELLSMLQQTESCLAGTDMDLDSVELVMDEDQRRTSEARRPSARH